MATADLWLDVTTLLRCQGRINGIPRTVSQLAGALAQAPGLRVRFCAFQDWRRRYVEVPRPAPADAVRPTESLHSTAPPRPCRSWRGWLRSLHRALPADLQQASREGYSALQYLKTFLSRLGRASLMNLHRGLDRGAVRLGLRRDAPILFKDGDVLFIPGASWDDLGAFDALARIRRSRRLSIIPLVYDVIPARLPQACEPRLPQLFTPWIRKLLVQSDLILTISHWSRRDLLALAEEWGVPAPPVEVIRLGDAPAGFERSARPANLPPDIQTFALSVGTLEVRKNHWLLYHAWRRLIERFGDRTPPLVLAGGMGWATKDLRHLIQADPLVRDRIILLFDVSDEELSWLYRNCQFTLYPSHYEGWGLPVAESLVYGKYCICTNASSVPEVAGDLVDYHDPLDGMACMALIQRALFEPGFLQGREERIRQEFRGATWAECGARIAPLLEKSLGVQLIGNALGVSKAA